MPWRVTSRKTGYSAVAPERDDRGLPIQYAFHAWRLVGLGLGSFSFDDAVCTFVVPNIEPEANGEVEIRETGKVA